VTETVGDAGCGSVDFSTSVNPGGGAGTGCEYSPAGSAAALFVTDCGTLFGCGVLAPEKSDAMNIEE
jgi:hypothetical protein